MLQSCQKCFKCYKILENFKKIIDNQLCKNWKKNRHDVWNKRKTIKNYMTIWNNIAKVFKKVKKYNVSHEFYKCFGSFYDGLLWKFGHV